MSRDGINIFEYIEFGYNQSKKYSALGPLSPVQSASFYSIQLPNEICSETVEVKFNNAAIIICG